MRIFFTVGPIKVIPQLPQISAKAEFSLKNPYPGWIASARVATAADIIEAILR
jgi:hypothetical protein